MRTTAVLSALAVVSGAMLVVGTAGAKGPFRAELSPGDVAGPALMRGDWGSGSGDRYFEASAAFRAVLDGAIGAASVEEGDGVGLVRYIAPGLASVGLLVNGGLG